MSAEIFDLSDFRAATNKKRAELLQQAVASKAQKTDGELQLHEKLMLIRDGARLISDTAATAKVAALADAVSKEINLAVRDAIDLIDKLAMARHKVRKLEKKVKRLRA